MSLILIFFALLISMLVMPMFKGASSLVYPNIKVTVRNIDSQKINPEDEGIFKSLNKFPVRCSKSVPDLLNYSAVNLCGGDASNYVLIVEINFCIAFSNFGKISFNPGGNFSYGGSAYLDNKFIKTLPAGGWAANFQTTPWIDFDLKDGRYTFKWISAVGCCDAETTAYFTWQNFYVNPNLISIDLLQGFCEDYYKSYPNAKEDSAAKHQFRSNLNQ